MTLSTILRSLVPTVGRFTPSRLQHMAEVIMPPAFLAIGPFLILIDIPKRFQKADPEPSLEDLNAFYKGLQDGNVVVMMDPRA